MKNYFDCQDEIENRFWRKVGIGALGLLIMLGIFWGFSSLNLLSSSNVIDLDQELLVEESLVLESTEMDQEDKGELVIYVDLKGAVKHPGVYALNQGARLFDAIEKAGGFTEDAGQDALNLALLLEDQMMIEVLTVDEINNRDRLTSTESEGLVSDSLPTYVHSVREEGSVQNSLVNINRADQTELETLPNIGPKKASDIIAYRQEQGSFKSVEELQEVSGIGPKTFETLKSLITVDE
ncbi:helix-hairpin-helix domain-containing protein [Facklamia lactis]|uniref:helix-hairpin-helix domain-containing protein n=1 Tax=Facklamia lactis TaxID=2749967 RepID=UPI002E2BF1C3|nr:helix-hairpin-helix domain-containing protein [Facklamia lactis]